MGAEDNTETECKSRLIRRAIKIIMLAAFGVLAVAVLASCSSNNGSQPAMSDTQPYEDGSSEHYSSPLPLLKTDWTRVKIPDVGTIDIPPSMEAQGVENRGQADDSGVNSDSFIIQQKGMNNILTNKEIGSNASIIVNETTGAAGDYDSLDFDISEWTQSDISDLNDKFKEQVQSQFEGTSVQLQEWYPLQLEIDNGMSDIHVQYARTFEDNPSVLVNQYIFQNSDKMYTLTFSYEIDEAKTWAADLDYSFSTFRVAI